MTRRANGFTLVSAIFLMVVLVVLGVSLVTLSSVAHTTSAQYLQSVRANYAARAGVEWAVSNAGAAGGCSSATLSPGGALDGFTVTVACNASVHAIPNPDSDPAAVAAQPVSSQEYLVVDVTASSGTYGTPDYVLRKAQAKLLGPVTTP